MIRSLPFIFLLLAACQSPPSMFYQRSEYKVQRVGGLVVSTSPRFSRQEFTSTETEIQVEESWIAQNVDSKPIEISLSKATAAIKEKSYPLVCIEDGKTAATASVGPGEKVLLHCKWNFPKNPPTKSDLWVTFSIPISSGDNITSNKIIRAEDFR